jgi:hypothetical protein
MYVYVSIFAYVCIGARSCAYLCIYVYLYNLYIGIRIYACVMHVWICKYTLLCVHMYWYVYMYVCICKQIIFLCCVYIDIYV